MKTKECDCCGQQRFTVQQCWAFGTETYACAICRDDPQAELEAEQDWHDDRDLADATNSSDLKYRMWRINNG